MTEVRQNHVFNGVVDDGRIDAAQLRLEDSRDPPDQVLGEVFTSLLVAERRVLLQREQSRGIHCSRTDRTAAE
jgi:hypothetical protein